MAVLREPTAFSRSDVTTSCTQRSRRKIASGFVSTFKYPSISGTDRRVIDYLTDGRESTLLAISILSETPTVAVNPDVKNVLLSLQPQNNGGEKDWDWFYVKGQAHKTPHHAQSQRQEQEVRHATLVLSAPKRNHARTFDHIAEVMVPRLVGGDYGSIRWSMTSSWWTWAHHQGEDR
jgi:hypothetical protein